MKNCDDLVKDFNLSCQHCTSCHYELDNGYQDPQPITIKGVIYDTPCCIVMKTLKEKEIKFEYV